MNHHLIGVGGAGRTLASTTEIAPSERHQGIGLLSRPTEGFELRPGFPSVHHRFVQSLADELPRFDGQLHAERHRAPSVVSKRPQRTLRMRPVRYLHGIGRCVAHLLASLLDSRRSGRQRELDQRRFVRRCCYPRQCPHLRVGQCALLERARHLGEVFQGMRHPDFLARGRGAEVTAPVQPLGAVLEAPLEPPRTLVELANEDEKLIGRGIDVGGEGYDGVVEIVDSDAALGGGDTCVHESSLRDVLRYCHYIQHRVCTQQISLSSTRNSWPPA